MCRSAMSGDHQESVYGPLQIFEAVRFRRTLHPNSWCETTEARLSTCAACCLPTLAAPSIVGQISVLFDPPLSLWGQPAVAIYSKTTFLLNWKASSDYVYLRRRVGAKPTQTGI